MTKNERFKIKYLIEKYNKISEVAYENWEKDMTDHVAYSLYYNYLTIARELEDELL